MSPEPTTANDFVMVRAGLWRRYQEGFISEDEWSAFNSLLHMSDKSTGIVYTNATIMGSMCHMGYKKTQRVLYSMRSKKLIHYSDNRGQRGKQPLYIDKCAVLLPQGHKYYPRIFNEAGEFIGHDVYLAHIKVRKMALDLSKGMSKPRGLYIEGGGLSMPIMMDFQKDFEIFKQTLDFIGEIPTFCAWFVDFDGDFERTSPRILKGLSDKDLDLKITCIVLASSNGVLIPPNPENPNPKDSKYSFMENGQ